MKKLPAILASLAITLVVGVIMAVIGLNGLLNPNQVAVVNAAPGDALLNTAAITPLPGQSPDAQLADLQARLAQMQAHDKQLQDQLTQARQLIDQANQQIKQSGQQITDANTQAAQADAQVKQYQQVLLALQRAGVIRIDNNGGIHLGNGLGGNNSTAPSVSGDNE